MLHYDLIVIGGGAAGFFGAINAASLNPKLRILILEKSNKLLAKVRISGGGRCNVTHHEFKPAALAKHYPRGRSFIKRVTNHFGVEDTVEWFKARGVDLKVEDDGRMFPTSDRSATIINCFLREVETYRIEIKRDYEVIKLNPNQNGFEVSTSAGAYQGNKVLVTIGGHPQFKRYQWLEELGLEIIKPIPSLFTFNSQEKNFADLMGLSVSDASVKIEGTKYEARGPVLITHWGLSGPAVIRLSAWAAEHLFAANYELKVLVNWLGEQNEAEVRNHLFEVKQSKPSARVSNTTIGQLPLRLWNRLCDQAGINAGQTWNAASHKQLNRLVEQLVRCPFQIRGKTTFKEEFVTCGGVDLSEVDPNTMEWKKYPGLYFAGEVLNVDGETGGFNFQAAWSTAFVAATSIAGG
ncbi:MAG: NAD(P)/FAD-dependent oxidoreductase [Cyclobacteriaceae bacterium]